MCNYQLEDREKDGKKKRISNFNGVRYKAYISGALHH
jgi:hypothetical protein